ncbi:hypothetical protein [Candidatus Accumulibacter phosphatis]|uniref:hypothetical protein n=1 Tax=Candidatus Accumulibacter phosphatis TaxID=327160 RepID=UPI00145CDB01|nr:hypothetical protein [Candidatus Accumulibacter phosphatis]
MLRAAAKIVAASGAKAFSATWAAISHDDLETGAMHEPGFVAVLVLVLVLRADAPTATGGLLAGKVQVPGTLPATIASS